MKQLLFVLIGSLGLIPIRATATDVPSGNLLELHSCELYAGGCTVSSEAVQGGRYMLRVWEFTGGKSGDVDLAGLHVALLQSSRDNLAEPNSQFGEAVAYLPANITAKQKQSLLAWLKSAQPELNSAPLHVRTESMEFLKTASGVRFSAGNHVSVETKPLEKCDTRSCGEELWYRPRSAMAAFGVTMNRASAIREPLLQLTWIDSAQRSVFLGTFGERTPVVTTATSNDVFCGLGENFTTTAGYTLSPALVTR